MTYIKTVSFQIICLVTKLFKKYLAHQMYKTFAAFILVPIHIPLYLRNYGKTCFWQSGLPKIAYTIELAILMKTCNLFHTASLFLEKHIIQDFRSTPVQPEIDAATHAVQCCREMQFSQPDIQKSKKWLSCIHFLQF